MSLNHTVYALFLFTFSLLTTSLYAQKPIIKSIQQEKYAPNDDGDLAINLRIEQTFNRYGNVTRQEYFYLRQDGKLQSDRKKIHSYDSYGRHLNTLEYNGDNILEAEKKIIWDSKGNKTKVEDVQYTNGQQTRTNVSYKLEYDDNGNKSTEQYFDGDGNTTRNKTWFYNKENEVIRAESWIDLKNKPKKEIKVNYSRNSNGDLVKSVSVEKVNGSVYRKDVRIFNNNFVIQWKKYLNGKLDSEFINEYRDSVIIRTTRKNKRKVTALPDTEDTDAGPNAPKKKKNKGDIWVTNSEYDAYGNIVITSQSVNGKVVHVFQYEYDEYGNCTRTIEVDKLKDLKNEEQLEYEKYGNIKKKTILKNGKIISREEFVFEYFER
ncbi:MAG: hypothetical protein MK212_03355 [Saprospiraceae bacterium]|nr:hypothetical protein [Saprospiraceae bacterium]